MSILFGVFPFGVVRKLLYHYCATLVLSYAEKSSNYADVDASK